MHTRTKDYSRGQANSPLDDQEDDCSYHGDNSYLRNQSSSLISEESGSQSSASSLNSTCPATETNDWLTTPNASHPAMARRSYKQGPPVPPRTPVPTPVVIKDTPPCNQTRFIALAVTVLVISVYALFNRPPSPSVEEECRNSLIRLRKEHPEQDPYVINSIQVASKGLLKDEFSVNSIVLLYSSLSESVLSFVEDVLASSGDCTVSGKSTPIVLRRENFTTAMEEDPGRILITFGDQLKKEMVMLVNDLHLLPSSLAPAFHSICDRYTPWAHPATIFFTMEVSEPVTESTNLDVLASNILRSKWSRLPSNVLDPLITRITDQVLFIN